MSPVIIKNYSLRCATEDDCKSLAPRLRAEDVTELYLADEGDPEAVLLNSLKNSKKVISVLDQDDTVQMMFGVGWTRTPRVGLVWMLSSDWIVINNQVVARFTKPLCAWLLADHDIILNFVHDENTVSMRWLEWQGFIPLQHNPEYGRGAPFTEMALFKDDQTRRIYLERYWPQDVTLQHAIDAG